MQWTVNGLYWSSMGHLFLPLSTCFKSLCTTLLMFIFPLAMDSGILPPGLLCPESAWCSFRNSDKDQYEDEVKFYTFQRIPKQLEPLDAWLCKHRWISRLHWLLGISSQASHSWRKWRMHAQEEGCLLLVSMPQNTSALGVQTSRNSLDKALAQALFVKWLILRSSCLCLLFLRSTQSLQHAVILPESQWWPGSMALKQRFSTCGVAILFYGGHIGDISIMIHSSGKITVTK